jgi:hypothetical protein
MQRPAKALVVTLAFLGYAAVAAWAGGSNLEYYSKDMPIEELKDEMKVLQRSVGAQGCEYCHVVKPKRDFANDSVEQKKTTRFMLKMTEKVNKELFTKDALGIKEGDAPKATCYMCHKGKEKPVYEPQNDAEKKLAAKFEEECKKPDNASMVTAMKKVVEKLNKDSFTWKKAPKATCWMCHRGSAEFSTKLPD